jgi:endonuclease I
MLGDSSAGEYARGLGPRSRVSRSTEPVEVRDATCESAAADSPTIVETATLIRHRNITAGVICIAVFIARSAWSDAYDPPVGYYSSATGTGGTLKSQLNDIIDGHTTRSYDQIRTDLQVTDAVPGDPTKIYVVYNNRVPITKPTGGSTPGWDNGVTWNREHSWPQDRGVDATSAPDGSDMHHVIPSIPSDNTIRDNNNFGGAFGQQSRGLINDGGVKYYPGDLDAGFIARAQFYMAVRYDGTESGTANLELAAGNPATGGTTLGDLNRLIEWHFAAQPDEFERRRNDVIFEDYQDNRNPFVDRPEFVWSVFVDQFNDSRITIEGGIMGDFNGSTRSVDLGRVFTGSAVPAAQTFTLNKAGTDGTYFEVTTAGDATSSVTGRYNAFRTNQIGSKTISVGLSTSTATAGLRSGTVTVDNLDVTSYSVLNDMNDVFNVSLSVLDHATPSYSHSSTVTTMSHDFGTITTAAISSWAFQAFNREMTPGFTANLDFDAVLSSGDTASLTLPTGDLVGSLVLPGGASQLFTAYLNSTAVGSFAASYTLRFSDENIAGAHNNLDLTLSLTGAVVLAGDFNRDNTVDAADYLVWRKTDGTSTPNFSGADADGSGFVDLADLAWWELNFGQTANSFGGSQQVPEASAWLLVAFCVATLPRSRRATVS